MKRGPSTIPLKGGDEYDALTTWRRAYNFGPGVRAWIKNKFNRRVRKESKKQAEIGDVEGKP